MHPDKVDNLDHIQYGLIEEVLEFLMEIPKFGDDPNRIDEEAGDVLWYVVAYYEAMRWTDVTKLNNVISYKHSSMDIMLALQKFIKNIRKLDINHVSYESRKHRIFDSLRVICEALKAYTELPLHQIARGNMKKLYKKWEERHSESSD